MYLKNFDGEISKKTCVERILNYGCVLILKKELIDRDCKGVV